MFPIFSNFKIYFNKSSFIVIGDTSLVLHGIKRDCENIEIESLKKIDIDMRNKNFKNIARKYNGPNFEKNKYDKDLEKFYKEFGGKI